MRVLGLITARGGSKGVPRKNIRPLAGKPLLQYTAEAALAARGLTRVLLSTDDTEIAEIGRQCGLEVPFLRPAELAQDHTPTLPVIQHAVDWLEHQGEAFEAICLLQPTNPLRGPDVIDACLELFEQVDADSLVTMLPVPAEYNPHWVYFREPDGQLRLTTGACAPIPRRQELPPSFHREGSVYVTRRDVLMEDNSMYGRYLVGYEMDPAQSINIDTPADWERAVRLLAQKEQQPARYASV